MSTELAEVEDSVSCLQTDVAMLQCKLEALSTQIVIIRESIEFLEANSRRQEERNAQKQFLSRMAVQFTDFLLSKVLSHPKKRRAELRCSSLMRLREEADRGTLTSEEFQRWAALKDILTELDGDSWIFIERTLKDLKNGYSCLDLPHLSRLELVELEVRTKHIQAYLLTCDDVRQLLEEFSELMGE